MNAETKDTLVTVEPAQAAKACVIWLHGLGADGYDFKPIIPYLKLPEHLSVRFLFPHAEVMPVTVNGGMPMRAWYDILEMNIERKVDKAALIRSSERIADLIQAQIELGIPADKIVLAGFSQGGAVAYHTALCYPQRLAGLIALSTYTATLEEITRNRSAENSNLPVMIAHGTMDDVVPVLLGEQARTALETLQYKPHWLTYPMGHEVVIEEIEAIGQWITESLAS